MRKLFALPHQMIEAAGAEVCFLVDKAIELVNHVSQGCLFCTQLVVDQLANLVIMSQRLYIVLFVLLLQDIRFRNDSSFALGEFLGLRYHGCQFRVHFVLIE